MKNKVINKRIQKQPLIFFLILICLILSNCGRAYFPIELKTISRAERVKGQEDSLVTFVPMTEKNIKKANQTFYKRRVIEAGDLKQPAKTLLVEDALVENFPQNNDPGPYLLGVGDVITYKIVISNSQVAPTIFTRRLVVSADGYISLGDLGKFKVGNLTLSEVEDMISTTLIEKGRYEAFELFIEDFNSKKLYVYDQGGNASVVKYTNIPIFLEDIISQKPITNSFESKVTILRGSETFTVALSNIYKSSQSRVRLFPNDKITIRPLNYRTESVLIVGETGAQRTIAINSTKRHTLSDAIFNGSVLNAVTSDFSQIYVLRKDKKQFNAFHLDITNPTRISLSNKFEMRPDDIVFVATQPLSLYSRTLSQILGSTGLTLQARDVIRSEIAN